jgi:hypothetical protein
MVIVSLWVLFQTSFAFIDYVFGSPAPLVPILMDPHGYKPRSSPAGPLRAARVVVVVADFYHDFVPEEDQATMSVLEAEVRLVKGFKDDEKIEQ